MRLLRLKRTWVFLLLPLSLGLVSLAGAHPDATERIYSTTIYPALLEVFGRLFSVVPFSIAQCLLVVLPVLLLAYIIRTLLAAIRDKEQRKDRVARLTATLLCVAGVGYFLFVASCGLNYHRHSFADISGLSIRPSSADELYDLCIELAQQANDLRAGLPEDHNGVASLPGLDKQAVSTGRAAYAALAEAYPQLGGYTVRPKGAIFSRFMSYLNITGIYVPFTFEANVNTDILSHSIPSTAMHEVAHSKGFMREDEANFISYLACTASEDAGFQYSGTVLALTHSANALYAADADRYWELREQYGDGLLRDLAASSAYWKQFEGPVAEVSTAVNDAYLKSNRQEQGVKSYGRMVDLLLADYRQRHGLE